MSKSVHYVNTFCLFYSIQFYFTLTMKRIYSIIALLGVLSCSDPEPKKDIISEPVYKELPTFKTLIDQANVKGAILIYDVNANTYFSNNFIWAKSSFLPASTFKIPNSIISLETGVMKADTSAIKWDGQPRRFEVWEQDLTLKSAFHYSCVPCYQEIARNVGLQRMQTHLSKLKFGEMDVDSANLDIFWLQGESRISAFNQIDFLQRFNTGKLPITERTESIMKDLMIITENDSIVIRGKTGWSNQYDVNNGWFVGYVERDNNVYYFATNIEPRKGVSLKTFAELRRSLTYRALSILYAQ